MKQLSSEKAITRRRLLRLNVAIGMLVFVVAFTMNITGEYSNLAELKSADTMFNFFAIGGLLYAASTLIYCLISKPFWFPETKKRED